MNLFKKIPQNISAGFSFFMHLRLWQKVIGVGVVLAALGFAIFQFVNAGEKAPDYLTAQVERGTLVTSVTSSGTITSANNASIKTSATGVVKEVLVKNGDTVTQGQPLAILTLDQTSQQAQASSWSSYLTAQNNLNSTKSQMNSLQAALFEANQAFVTNSGTDDPDTDDPTYIIERATWLQAEADYVNQQGVVAQAEAAVTSAWLSYSLTSGTITAPMIGKVRNLTIVPGQTVTSESSETSTTNPSQSVGSITSENGQLQATVNLSEVDVTKVEVGQKVTITVDALSDKTFTGKISSIDTNGSVSSGVTTYPATITFDTTAEKVYPSMAMNATIISSVKQNALLVPSSAIQQSGDTKTVRVLKDGQVTSVSVETGVSSDTQTEILSGVTEGQTVVTGTAVQMDGGSAATSSPFGGGQRGFGGGGTNVIMRTQ